MHHYQLKQSPVYTNFTLALNIKQYQHINQIKLTNFNYNLITKKKKMSQIINLFKTKPNSISFNNLQASSKSYRAAPFSLSIPTKDKSSSFIYVKQPSKVKESWNLGQLQSLLKQGVKKQLDTRLMKEQIDNYQTSIKSLFWHKLAILTLITIGLIILMGLQGSTIFTLCMFMFIKLIHYQKFNFNNQSLINQSLNLIQPLIYCSLSYSLFKWIINIQDRQFNWSLTIISIFMTIVNNLIRHYQPFYIWNVREYTHRIMLIRSNRKKITKFPMYMVRIMQLIFMLKFIIATALVISIGVMLIIVNILKIEYWMIFTQIPKYTLEIIIIFMFLTFYQTIIDFINLTNINQLSIIINKMPIFLNLLRLQSSSKYNNQIQAECLKSLYLKMMKSQYYLTTETSKYLIYATYMDIFNQYAIITLQNLNTQVLNFIAQINTYDRILSNNLTLVQDLFIYFRKLACIIQAQRSSISIIDKLSSNELLFYLITIAKNQSQDNKDSIGMSRRLLDLVHNLRQKLKECSQKKSISLMTKNQMIRLIQQLQKDFNKDERQQLQDLK